MLDKKELPHCVETSLTSLALILTKFIWYQVFCCFYVFVLSTLQVTALPHLWGLWLFYTCFKLLNIFLEFVRVLDFWLTHLFTFQGLSLLRSLTRLGYILVPHAHAVAATLPLRKLCLQSHLCLFCLGVDEFYHLTLRQ